MKKTGKTYITDSIAQVSLFGPHLGWPSHQQIDRADDLTQATLRRMQAEGADVVCAEIWKESERELRAYAKSRGLRPPVGWTDFYAARAVAGTLD